MAASNTQLLAAIDARHRLSPEEEAVLERSDALERRMRSPVDRWPVIEYEDWEAAVLAWRRAEGRG